MKKFEKLKAFVLGVVITLLITTTISPVFAATIETVFNAINIKINGEQAASIGESYILDNGDEVPFSILYKGTTYLPLRKIAELYGKDVHYDDNTKTASINDKGSINDDYYIEFAKKAIEHLKSGLRNPNSLILNDAYKAKETVKLYGEDTETVRDVIVLDYSATNGFGGYARNNYVAWYVRGKDLVVGDNYVDLSKISNLEKLDINKIIN